jgi:nucleoside phosphorylase
MAGGISKVVVLTALGVERAAIVGQLEDVAEHEQRGTIYDVGRLRGAAQVQVAVAEIGAGNIGSGIHLERAITAFEPDLVAFVGVAGGVKDVAHGDVVVASKIYGYESGKADREFLTRPVAHPLAYRLEQRARRVIAAGAWAQRLPPGQGRADAKALLGPIAAGDSVIKSTKSDLFRRIKRSYNDTIAVEMEGAGLFAGAHLNDSVPALVVRGISDLIDDKDERNDEIWHPIAAANAAAFAAALLAALAGVSSPLEVGTREDLRAITADLADAYYLNLDRLLSDPSALCLFSGWVPERLRRVCSWKEVGFGEAGELRHAAEVAIERWAGTALPLEEAVEAGEVGSRVVFDGTMRTRNWKRYNPETGLLGDLGRDPLVYIDVAGRRVFMPIDPRWATTATGRLAFTKGQIRMSGVALLRDVLAESAWASPYVLAPPAASRRIDRLLFGP